MEPCKYLLKDRSEEKYVKRLTWHKSLGFYFVVTEQLCEAKRYETYEEAETVSKRDRDFVVVKDQSI